jgi:hypothetical protein
MSWNKKNTGQPDLTDNARASIDLIADRIDNVEKGLSGDDNLTTVDINGGTIDGTPIGVTEPDSGSFTTLEATTLTASGVCSLGATFKDWTLTGFSKDINYQAPCDLFVLVNTSKSSQRVLIEGFTDSDATPDTRVWYHDQENGDGDDGAISGMFPVKKGDYWKVTGISIDTIRTLAFGI